MVEYHDEAEADFQQYYQINLDTAVKEDFARVSRLFAQLPPTSRVFCKASPLQDWTWDREMQSQILLQLGVISDQLSKFGTKKRIKAPRQLQPDYVEAGKKKLKKLQKDKKRKEANGAVADIEFWQNRYKNIKMESV